MKNIKYFFSAGSIFVAGMIIGSLYFQHDIPSVPEDSDDYKVKYENLKSQFQSIREVDIEEYIKLKSQKQRYEKADEILAKIWKIFLLDLGIRMAGNEKQVMRQAMKNPANSSPDKAVQPQNNNVGETRKVENKAPPKKASVAEVNWKTKEKKLKEIGSVEDEEEFLKSVEIEDSTKAMGSLSAMDKNFAYELKGKFEGQVNYLDVKNKAKEPSLMKVEFEPNFNSPKVTANVLVQLLSLEGQAFSTTSGEGNLKGFQKFGQGSQAIYIECCGGSGFFQFYRLNDFNRLIGNYYVTEKGKTKKIGTAYLDRR